MVHSSQNGKEVNGTPAKREDDPEKVFKNWPDMRELPALSAVAGQIIQLTSADPFRWEECIRLFESDAGLSAKLLKLVNSSYYGLRGSIASVNRAARLLGEVTFRCLALGLAVAGSLPRPALKPFDGDLFWSDNLIRALFIKTVAEELKAPTAPEVFSAALLQNMGIPLLLYMPSTDYRSVLDAYEQGKGPLHVLEREKYGWDHALLGSVVAERWRFPSSMSLAIRRHHDPITETTNGHADERLVPWVQLSAIIPSSKVEDPASWKEAVTSLITYMPDLDLIAIAEKVDDAFEELATLFRDGDVLGSHLADHFYLAEEAE